MRRPEWIPIGIGLLLLFLGAITLLYALPEKVSTQGKDYDTALASRSAQFIEAAVLGVLAAVLFGIGLRMRRRRQTSVGSPAVSQTTREPNDEPASTRSASERG
jgi:predicted membrane protein